MFAIKKHQIDSATLLYSLIYLMFIWMPTLDYWLAQFILYFIDVNCRAKNCWYESKKKYSYI